jgi:hypothetical protein
VYDLTEQAYPKHSSDHIAEFAFGKNMGGRWINRQDIMYQIKHECARQGLLNGTDYVFLNPAATNRNYHGIQIWFKDASYVSYMSMWYDSQELQR